MTIPEGNQVQCDIRWEDSWRASWKESGTDWTNWDAVWLFVKYREKGTRNWRHATLSTRKSDHSAPAGAELDVGLAGEKGVGVFLYRSAEGKGTWSNTGVKLTWLHRDDGVENTATTDIRVNALEMVYVPRGSYLVGEKGEVAGTFCDGATVLTGMKGGGSWTTGNVIAFRITGEAELTLTNAPGFLWGSGEEHRH